jgi:hypothetical protein
MMKKIIVLFLLCVLIPQAISTVLAWELERPYDNIKIEQRVDNIETNNEASVGLGVEIRDYHDNISESIPRDYLLLNMTMTANSRKGLDYTSFGHPFWWISPNELYDRRDITNVDDEIFPIEIPQGSDGLDVRFYGGPGSSEYRTVYVSDNGFISFHNITLSSAVPSAIPCPDNPSAIVAAVWTDLAVDNYAKIVTGRYEIVSNSYFVVIWENVTHKQSQNRLTFEIILENAYNPFEHVREKWKQSKIWLSYSSVTSINTSFAYGIEDQQGYKGLGGLADGSSLEGFSGTTIQFEQYTNNFFLKRLTLLLDDTEPETDFDILDNDHTYLRGYNVKWDQLHASEIDWGYTFIKAIAGTATLLIGFATFGGGWLTGGGLIVDGVLATMDWTEWVAQKQYSSRLIDVYDVDDGWHQRANASVLAYDNVVDATMSIYVHWILRDRNDLGFTPRSHSLTIRAILEYYEYSTLDGSIIDKLPLVTGTILKVAPDNYNSLLTASPIESNVSYSDLFIGEYDSDDFFRINVPVLRKAYIQADAVSYLDTSNPDFEVHVYDPYGTHRFGWPHGYHHYHEFQPDMTGNWTINIHKYENHGYYSLNAGFVLGPETFYFRSDKATVNGLFTEKLLISQSGTVGYKTRTDTDPECAITRAYWGVRVYKRSSAGVETQITSSTSNPVARVYRDCTSEGIQSATWPCPEIPLATTDSIVIRVYTALYDPDEGFYTWQLQGTWTTPQLGVTRLNASTSTVYYYTYWLRQRTTPITLKSRFYYDTPTYNSRVAGITY